MLVFCGGGVVGEVGVSGGGGVGWGGWVGVWVCGAVTRSEFLHMWQPLSCHFQGPPPLFFLGGGYLTSSSLSLLFYPELG